MTIDRATHARLEELRTELRAQRISYGELAELQELADTHRIPPDDFELLEAAGVSEEEANRRVKDAASETAPFRYTHTLYPVGLELIFEWHGGAYIDVTAPPHDHPSEVINVWDYVNDVPRIERTQKAFRAKCEEWVENYPEDALIHDVRNNWS